MSRPSRRLPLALACCVASLPVAARAGEAPEPPAAPAEAEPPPSAERLGARIATCEKILREFQADADLSIPPEVLRQARALVVVNQVKGSLVFGLQYGGGVVLARRPDGSWSVPVLLRAGEASLGVQVGGRRIETIYALMDDEAVRRLYLGRANIGADLAAVAGPRAFEAGLVNREILATPVLVYGRGHGLYAGAAVKTGWLERDDSANRDFYQTTLALPELLFGDEITPPAAVRPLMDYVTAITR